MTPREVMECPHCGEATQVNRLPQAGAFCSRAAHHAGQRFLIREHANALGQIFIGSAVLCDIFANHRQRLEGPGIVNGFQRRDLNPGKFQAMEAPTGAEHTPRFGQYRILVGTIAKPKGDRHPLHTAVRQGDAFSIHAHEGKPADQPA